MHLILCVLLSMLAEVSSILCYNCTSTSNDFRATCVTPFTDAKPASFVEMQILNDITVNCSEEKEAYCFVRAAKRRSRHVWITQRGCYYPQSAQESEYMRSGHHRGHMCETKRKENTEITLCVCFSDHCNSSNMKRPFIAFIVFLSVFTVVV